MSIVNMGQILRSAEENKYAVGYFESFNMESTQAVIDAAEKAKSPVIIGYSGVFTNSPKREIRENIYHYGAMAYSMAQNASIPVSIILNEADDMSMLIQSINAGFNVVMYQKLGDNFEDMIRINKYLVRTAHYLKADVECEVGELPEAHVSDGSTSGGINTDPEKAKYFVEQTGIDALAIAIGNVHLLEGEKSRLDFDLLKRIRRAVSVPLVLHGGTGIDDEEAKEAIALGVTKFNIGTVLKRSYLKVYQNFCCNKNISKINPHELIGLGGTDDVMCSARKAIAEDVYHYIRLYGSENKAHLV